LHENWNGLKCIKNHNGLKMKKMIHRSFSAEKTLGKLAKWLRILGFDTIDGRDFSDNRSADTRENGRIWLTRTVRVRDRYKSRELIFIKSDHPFEQLAEVIQALNIDIKDIKPFSRCIRCNTPIEAVSKYDVKAMVPDYTWETEDGFQFCSRCRKVYWAGSHTKHSKEKIRRLFAL
jgi:uncharacterized protein with PIN domain